MNAQDSNGNTALHLVREENKIDLLKKHGGLNPNIKNNFGNNAVEHFYISICLVLLKSPYLSVLR